jgi:hypothetical protein
VAEPAADQWSPDKDQVEQVNGDMRFWRQGDFVEGASLVHVANPAKPLTPAAKNATEQEGSTELVLTREVAGLVAVTQTCDIVRSCADQPYVQVAQLVILPEKPAAQARGRRRPRYAHVPAKGDNAFSDLDAVMSVEKAVVAAWKRQEGCRTDAERRRFSEAVRRKASRFAFPGDVAKVLNPLRQELDKHDGKPTALGAAVAELREIRLLALPGWSGEEFDLYVYFVLPPKRETLGRTIDEWRTLAKGWLSKCTREGQVRSVEGDVHRADEMSADEYLESDQWDTDTFSP